MTRKLLRSENVVSHLLVRPAAYSKYQEPAIDGLCAALRPKMSLSFRPLPILLSYVPYIWGVPLEDVQIESGTFLFHIF